MGLTLNEFYKLDNDILNSLMLPILTGETESNGEWKPGRQWHDEVARPNILLQCGNFETLHTSPTAFKNELSVWSKMRLSVWTDMLRTTVQKYNLVHNYDRTEKWSETRKNTEDENTTRSAKSKTVGSDSRSGSNNSEHGNSEQSNSTSENKVSAYNSPEYSPKDRATITASGNNNGFTKNTYSDGANINSDTEANGNDTVKKNANESIVHESHISGNIGVTTTQQMLEEERRLALFNIVQFIIDDFKSYFCILVY